jgi:hypothetical protein
MLILAQNARRAERFWMIGNEGRPSVLISRKTGQDKPCPNETQIFILLHILAAFQPAIRFSKLVVSTLSALPFAIA